MAIITDSAIRKVVPPKSGARTIDCAMTFYSMIFILFYNDRFTSNWIIALTWLNI